MDEIYSFSSLETNFMINFCWVVLKSIFKSSADYRLSRLEDDNSPTGGILGFLEFKIVIFIFSFLVTFMIVMSLEFWSAISKISFLKISWWLPSAVSIILAEISNILAKLFDRQQEDQLARSGMVIAKTSRQMSIYFIISFLAIISFWVFNVFNSL